MSPSKLEVNRGVLLIEGEEWFLYCRKYPKNLAMFKSSDDEILVLDDRILDFKKRDIQTNSFKNLQKQRKVKNENKPRK